VTSTREEVRPIEMAIVFALLIILIDKIRDRNSSE
jgi:hypothetical protein